MKQKITEKINIPSGVVCEIKDSKLFCKKGSVELSRSVKIPSIEVTVQGDTIEIKCSSGNKNDYKIIKSLVAHVTNLFKGLEQKYSYKLEACNVHFPMTLKVDGKRFVINNFLGEKQPRYAAILDGVEVDIKGQKITVSSANKESAGQTTANIEKATRVRNRDRRIFQDGIYLVEKGGGSHG